MASLRLARERGAANYGWLQARYSFSFANYYDPHFMGFSSLRVINEDRVAPRRGFDTHGHQNMEILTYVLAGSLEHRDSQGNVGRLNAGDFQYMSAGSGIRHSENNPADDELHLLQIWIEPNEQGTEPSYQDKTLIAVEGWQLIAAADGRDASFPIRQQAELWRLRLTGAAETRLPPHQGSYYVHQVRGELQVAGLTLHAGDALSFGQAEIELLQSSDLGSETLVFLLA